MIKHTVFHDAACIKYNINTIDHDVAYIKCIMMQQAYNVSWYSTHTICHDAAYIQCITMQHRYIASRFSIQTMYHDAAHILCIIMQHNTMYHNTAYIQCILMQHTYIVSQCSTHKLYHDAAYIQCIIMLWTKYGKTSNMKSDLWGNSLPNYNLKILSFHFPNILHVKSTMINSHISQYIYLSVH